MKVACRLTILVTVAVMMSGMAVKVGRQTQLGLCPSGSRHRSAWFHLTGREQQQAHAACAGGLTVACPSVAVAVAESSSSYGCGQQLLLLFGALKLMPRIPDAMRRRNEQTQQASDWGILSPALKGQPGKHNRCTACSVLHHTYAWDGIQVSAHVGSLR